MSRRRATHADLIVTDVEALTLRDVAGDGVQAELLVKTRTGTLAVRLVGRRGIAFRLTDLRARDRKRRRGPAVAVPFADLEGAPCRPPS